VNNKTLSYYNDNANDLSTRYNSVDFIKIQKAISMYLIGSKKVLEIGCGSGRDADYMTNNGFDVTALDGSEEMLKSAESNYPRLKGKLIKAILPDEFPSFDTKFDAAYSIATLMHFNKLEINKILQKMKAILKPSSPVYISVSDKRSVVDNRFFIKFTKEDWTNIFEQNGFIINEIIESQDSSERSIVWYSFLMEIK
jgi:cyclopropane fatty-acyl-phospholipid synthase-like methyltransferase